MIEKNVTVQMQYKDGHTTVFATVSTAPTIAYGVAVAQGLMHNFMKGDKQVQVCQDDQVIQQWNHDGVKWNRTI